MATLKQQKAVKEIVENSSATMKEVVIKAGYSPETAKHPNQVTESKGFRELLDEMLPDELLTAKHQQLLESTKVISANVFPDGKDGKPVNDFIEVPDNQTQGKMVELGYKVKKHLVDKVEHSGEVRTTRSEEELDGIISKFRGEKEVSGSTTGKSTPKGK